MKNNFEASLDILLEHEGGYVNHPEDPGGRTNYGITQRVYENFLGRKVTEQEMRTMPLKDVQAIYKKEYWDRVCGDELPAGIDLCVFDWAVNAGTRRASKALQQVVGAGEDGIIGPQTVSQVSALNNSERVVELIATKREEFYRSLKTFDTFGRGWLRRNEETRDKALNLAQTTV